VVAVDLESDLRVKSGEIRVSVGTEKGGWGDLFGVSRRYGGRRC
jgi:hypothetical protein